MHRTRLLWKPVHRLLILLTASLLFVSSPIGILQALETPGLEAPESGLEITVDNYPPLAVPELRWTPVPGATSYRIQLSQEIGFATAQEFTTANTSYTPINVASIPDGTWYWRVRADAPAPAGAYSGYRSFTKLWASANNAPSLISPGDGTALDFYAHPAFAWQPVTGAASYCFQIATSVAGFSSSCTASGTQVHAQATLAATYQPPAKFANGTYYWRVVPIDPGNRNGTASIVRSFVASYIFSPELLEPADLAVPSFTPALSWQAVPGAQFYRLQYSTDPTFNTGITQVDTRNTVYRPVDPLANDFNYYWRVRVHSGNSIGDWSAVRSFFKKWQAAPQLLTPTNNYQSIKDPFFSWTPVPGAAYYKIEINRLSTSDFPPTAGNGWSEVTTYPFYAQPERILGIIWCWTCSGSGNWYWRVIPFDSKGNQGQPSQVFAFRYSPTDLAPQLLHPLYYYLPDAGLQPHEDRTVSQPVFMWQRDLSYTLGFSGLELPAYRLEVDDDPGFGAPLWTVDTENLAAVPSVTNPFTPTGGNLYFWRVRPLASLGGALTHAWSQTWVTRIDSGQALTPTADLTLLRPAHGHEAIEIFPLLEWWPLAGANGYQVQVSTDPDFATAEIDTTVPYPAFVSETRHLYGTYYWRVRGLLNGSPLGGWSAMPAWRFQIAAQSHWRTTRTVGDVDNRLLVTTDPAGDTVPNYDLTGLYMVQSKDDWYFGFDATATAQNMRYALYLDLDHEDNSGASSDARGYDVTTIVAHQPEYAIYVLQSGGTFATSDVTIYQWTGSNWAAPQSLSAGGALSFDGSYVELRVPSTAIGMEESTGSAAVTLFSVPEAGGVPQDSVPSDPAITGNDTADLSRFTSVSERLYLATPPSNQSGDPRLLPTLPPFRFHFPVDSQWYGYQFRAATDQQFTSVKWNYTIYATSAAASPLVPAAHTYNANAAEFAGDNTYYWQVRTVYSYTNGQPSPRGAWSQPARFERQGFVPQVLTTSVTFATPTFSWSLVEAAQTYEIQVDNDANFGSPEVNAVTAHNTYTPITTLADGTYHWRVRVRQRGAFASALYDVIGDWTPTEAFDLSLPAPVSLVHQPSGVVSQAPSLCWQPLVVSVGNTAVLAAYKYRVQVGRDLLFSTIFDTIDTEQACWTPAKGYADGTYYWRVAMIDGNTPARVGTSSSVAQFTKQYPIPVLIEPASGSNADSTPTFVWEPLSGAAEYRLEVSQFNTFAPLYDSVTTDNTRFTPTKQYVPGRLYYWRVAIVDKNGNLGPWQGATVIVGGTNLDPALYLPMIVR